MTTERSDELRIDVERIYVRHPFAKAILERLGAAGHEAVLVGGAVRDALLARLEGRERFEPREVDIATSARPEEVEALFREARVLTVGRAFGVLKVVAPDGHPYEVATFRAEEAYDGRRPGRVEPVRDLELDLKRRDFTVNGLAARPDGSVIDRVGGVRDLKERTIRTIGDPDARFREDYLRMMRAVRFACHLDAEVAPETARAIRAHRDGLKLISQERIRDELLAVLMTSRSHRGVRLLDDLDLLELILPELVACKGIPQPEDYHPEGDVYVHALLALEVADRFARDPLLKLAVLLHDVGKPRALERNRGENAAGHDAIGAEMAREVAGRLRLSRDQTELLAYLVAEHQRIGHFPEMGRGKRVKFIKQCEDAAHSVSDVTARYPWFGKLVQLMIADCQASAMKSKGWLSVLQNLACLLIHLDALERRTQARKLIDGHDLLEMGVPQGVELGALLEELHDKIYAGELTSREEALELAKRFIEERDLRRV